MREKFNYIKEFLTTGIWSIKQSDISPKKALQIKALRILIISIRGIYEDKIQQRAAALTLYSMLSVVPVIALGFAVAKGFGYDQYLQNEVLSFFDQKIETGVEPDPAGNGDLNSAYKQVAQQLFGFADALLAKTQGGLMAVISIIVLFWTIMNVLGNIESAFNDIWQVKKPRSFMRKFTDYFSMMFIAPIIFITAIVGIVSLQSIEVHALLSPFLFIVVKFLPIILLILLFTLIFMVMPNIKVTLRAGLVGGILTGTIFFIVQQVYIFFQIGVSQYNAIYGGFAALPLFIIWMQISWLIVLFGAKISFATQNYQLYEFESTAIQLSDYSRRILALLVVHRVIQNFQNGQKPNTTVELSQDLHIPPRILKEVLNDVIRCRILSEVVSDKPKVSAYQPAQNIDTFSIKYVMASLDKLGDNTLVAKDSDLTRTLISLNEDFFKAIETHPGNKLLKDL